MLYRSNGLANERLHLYARFLGIEELDILWLNSALPLALARSQYYE